MVYTDLNFFKVDDSHFVPIDPRVELSTFINSLGEKQDYVIGLFPVSVFICNEIDDVQIVTTTKTQSTYYHAFLTYPNTRGVPSSLRFELFSGNYNLTEHTTFETSLTTLDGDTKPFQSNFYSYHSIFSSLRLNLFWYSTFAAHVNSHSSVFLNSVWLERESSEMFNTHYVGLSDSRKLLLDYSTPRGPLLLNESQYMYNYYHQNLKYPLY